MQREQRLSGLQKQRPEGRLSLEGTTHAPGRVSLGLGSQGAAAPPCKGHSGAHTPHLGGGTRDAGPALRSKGSRLPEIKMLPGQSPEALHPDQLGTRAPRSASSNLKVFS